MAREISSMSNRDGVVRRCRLPNDDFTAAWTSIKLAQRVHERLLAQSLLSLAVQQELSFEAAPLHGLIRLTGPPGTGKTTIALGLANQITMGNSRKLLSEEFVFSVLIASL